MGAGNASRVDPSLAPGARVGRYTVVELLATGGMGEVYSARDERLERDVAIKVLPRRLARSKERVARFLDEIRLVSALDHANVVAVYDAGRTRGMPYAVAELLRGETLRARLRFGELDVAEAVGLAIQIGRGLVAAHASGAIHRDLKPENVFVTRAGVVKILDFGIARLSATEEAGSVGSDDDTLDEPPGISGTASYMAPEQIRGEREDRRTDIFAFGAVLYEMLSGRRAFTGTSRAATMAAVLTTEPEHLGDLVPSLPPLLVKIVHRCLAKVPTARFQSADDLVTVLELVATDVHGNGAARWVVPSPPDRLAQLAFPVGVAFLVGVTLGWVSRSGGWQPR